MQLKDFKKMSCGEKIIFSGYFIGLITFFVLALVFSLKNRVYLLHEDVYIFSKKLDEIYSKAKQIEKYAKKK